MDGCLNILDLGDVLKCLMGREHFPGVPLAGLSPVIGGLACHHRFPAGVFLAKHGFLWHQSLIFHCCLPDPHVPKTPHVSKIMIASLLWCLPPLRSLCCSRHRSVRSRTRSISRGSNRVCQPEYSQLPREVSDFSFICIKPGQGIPRYYIWVYFTQAFRYFLSSHSISIFKCSL